jgi:2-polyprenyl-3-methyl-5-hydroxy-6-metoxy-1,4-benzoquinol methylase
MIVSLRERDRRPEWMDVEQAGGEELLETYRHLRRLNRLFGASGPVLYGVRQWWIRQGRPRQLTILDVGAGSGDVNRRLLRFADRHGIGLRIILIDRSEEACIAAKRYYAGESRVEVRQVDLHAIPPRCADIVTASQFIHHFTSDELPSIVERLVSISRIGVVLSDIHRHVIPWTAVWLATRLISGNRLIRHDGPLSVARGFRAADWRSLSKALPGYDLSYAWRPLFRYAVLVGRRSSEEALADRPCVRPDEHPGHDERMAH